MSKTKWYYYQTYVGKDGELKERSIPQKKINSGDYDWEWEDISRSRDNPKIRKLKREGYNDGFFGIGHKTGAIDYNETVEWGKQGGRPKKWASDAERKKVQRLKIKISQNKPLKEKQKQLALSHNLLAHDSSSSSYSHSGPRPGSYTYHSGRPATPRERKARYRWLRGIANKSDLQILGIS